MDKTVDNAAGLWADMRELATLGEDNVAIVLPEAAAALLAERKTLLELLGQFAETEKGTAATRAQALLKQINAQLH